MEQVYTPKQNYKVLVNCMTYNQSKYIEDALNGFAMQKTDFPFACLVMDDASTDGEQDVIKAWMERECDMERAENVEIEKSFITLVPHKTNPSCSFAFYFLKENLYGTGEKTPLIAPWREHCEYEALCEGDDYWIDENKLQLQVKVLDEDENSTLVLSNGLIGRNREESKIINPYLDRESGYLDMHTLLRSKGGLVPTASMLYRICIGERPESLTCNRVGDKPLRMWCAINGKVYYFERPLVFYRHPSDNSFGQTVTKSPQVAFQVYEDFCCFLDNFDEYTGHKYHRDIEFMKDKEEYMYLSRVNSPEIYKCKYLRRCVESNSWKLIILYFLKYKMTHLYTVMRSVRHLIH